MAIDPKRGDDLLAQLFAMKNLPCAPDPKPSYDGIDYEALAIQIWGHWPGPLDAQQQHDLVVEAKAQGLL
jgi:hypothetical protein